MAHTNTLYKYIIAAQVHGICTCVVKVICQDSL